MTGALEFFEAIRAELSTIEAARAAIDSALAAGNVHGFDYGRARGHGGTTEDAILDAIAASDALDERRAAAQVDVDEALAILYGIDNRGGLAKAVGTRYADCICMHYLQLMSFKECAEELGYTSRWCRYLAEVGLAEIDEAGTARMKHYSERKGSRWTEA